MKVVSTVVFALLPLATACGDESDLRNQYETTIARLFATHCVRCHGNETAESAVTLHDARADSGDSESVALWARVLEQLETGSMPPEDEPSPAPGEREQLIRWIRELLTQAGKGYEIKAKLLLPEFGNRVNHELLFGGDITTPPYTPARLWRMSPHVYRGKRYPARIAGGIEAEPVTYSSKSSGIRDYASQEVMDESGFLSLKAALDDILTDRMHEKDTFKAITEATSSPSEDVLLRVIREEFYRATGRRVSQAEEARYLTFMQSNIQQAGNESGLKLSVLAIYLSTEAVYRLELGRGSPDEHGRRMLSPHEVALALAYALTDAPPSRNPILQAALEGDQLTGKDAIEMVVRRMIAAGHPPLRKNLPAAYFPRMVEEGESGFGWYPRVVRFFEEFFQYGKSAGTFKDSPGEGIGTKALVAWPQGHIAAIVNEDRHVFEELLTSPRLNNNRDEMLAYVKRRYAKELNEFPPDQKERATKRYQDALKHARHLKNETFRAGILTDNSWLIAHSTNDQNHPVLRGIWIRERLLADSLPALPLDVDARVPEDHDRTLRERYEVTQAERCWKCHRRMNPLGMPFESFDDRGWIRAARYFDKTNNVYLPQPRLSEDELAKLRKKNDIEVRPVDATGEISGTGEAGIDGPVKDARDLVHRLAKSTRVRQSIIRHMFRFWMGRNEMLSDSQTLIDADRAYCTSGGKFSEVLVSLLTSDSFLYRK